MNKEKYLGDAAFYKKTLMIAIPVMLQQLIQNMVSLIDNFMVAGLGDIKMSGVNVAGQILFIFMVFIGTVCTSGGIYMTQFSGTNDKKNMQQALMFKIIISFAAFFVYILVCVVFPRQVLSLMLVGNTDAEAILDVAVQYIQLMSIVGIPMTLSNIMASSLREIGSVKAPLVIAVTATCINTFCNWVFIYGNLGAPRLEVRGAAFATIIAMTAQMIMFFVYIMIKRPPFLISLKSFRHIDWKLFSEIFRKGSMVLVADMMWVISETITTALYNGRGGGDVVSGMASSFAIANLFFVAFGGMMTATGVILGQTLGRGEMEKAKQQKTWLLTAAIIFGCFMTFISLGTAFLVPVVFGNLSAGAQKICRDMVVMMAIFMPLWVYINTQYAVSRAGGDTAMGFWIDGIVNLFVIIPGAFILAIFTGVGPVFMYGATKIIDIPKIIIAHFWLKKEKWVNNLAERKNKAIETE